MKRQDAVVRSSCFNLFGGLQDKKRRIAPVRSNNGRRYRTLSSAPDTATSFWSRDLIWILCENLESKFEQNLRLVSFELAGKTRTKDKYRVVYTDHQRLELEKEFHYSRYITIRRKSELASVLGLSERQVNFLEFFFI
jgi:Homeodomain